MASSPQKDKNLCTFVIALLMASYSHSQNDEYFIRHPFKVITGSTYIKQLQVGRELECAFACNQNSQCKSFNFAVEKNFVGRFTCQLMSMDCLEKSLSETPNYDHYEMFHLNPCSSSPCKNGGTCSYQAATRTMGCKCKLGFSGQLCQTVHWTKLTTNSVCFGATGDFYAVFNIPKTGSLITVRLVHTSGQLTCNNGNVKGWNHWGCLDRNGNFLYMSVVITDNTDNIKFPGSDKFVEKGKVWNSIGMDAKSKELLFPAPTTPASVVSGQQYRVWFGQDLANQSDTDNGGKVCVEVFGLYQ